jgi:hypothetical protein
MTSVSSSNGLARNTAITATNSRIATQQETLYHQSNLLGTWSGNFGPNKSPVTFSVEKINGSTATIEFDHNGQKQKANASISNNIITFGNYQIATKDGQSAVLLFQSGSYSLHSPLTKTVDPSKSTANQNPLVGAWSGLSSTGNAASFTVKSITGNSADVTYAVNGVTNSGTGTYNASNNVISFGQAQISTNPMGQTNIVYSSLGQTYSIAATKASTTSTSTTTSTFA